MAFLQIAELRSAEPSQVVTFFFGQLQVGEVIVPAERIADPRPFVRDVLFQFHKKSLLSGYIVPVRRDVCECVNAQKKLLNSANRKLLRSFQ